MQKPVSKSNVLTASVLALAIAGGLAGCSKGETTATTVADREAALDARAEELAKREAALVAKEQAPPAEATEPEVIQEPPAAKPRSESKPKPVVRRVATAEPESQPRISRPAPPPRIEYIEVPAGTVLNLTLASDLSSRTAVVGDPVEARLANDLMVGNQRVSRAGARVTGTVREVVSGANTIGAVPVLALQFDRLEDLKGEMVPVNGDFSAQGASEKGQDAAKIIGGAAVGAFIGDKIDKKKGKKGAIIGGLLGGATGAVVAKKTGTEVALTQGYEMSVTLNNGFRVAGN
jgi:outer membrane lipoprotein SlyB